MIAECAADEVPRVARFEGRVAVYVPQGEDDNHGFLLSAGQALDTAVAMLGAVDDLASSSDYGFDVDGMQGRIVKADGDDPEAILTFTLRKASFSVRLTPTQLAELAVGLRIGVDMADRPSGRPRHDR